MHDRVQRAATAAVATTALLLAAAPRASAEATDLPLAIAETSAAAARAAADALRYNTESPEVTCANPNVSGAAVVPPVYHPGTVAVWGKDVAQGEGHCVSLQPTRYTVSIEVVVEWRYAPNDWRVIPGCTSSSSAPASDGYAVTVVLPFRCEFDPAGPAAGMPHRVHGFLTNSVTTRVYEGFSPVYLAPQDDDMAAAP